MYLSGPYKGYGPVPAALGNGAKPNGEYKQYCSNSFICIFILFSTEKLILK